MADGGNAKPVIIKCQLNNENKDDDEDSYLVNEEYETQLFGFTPTSFTDKMYNIYFDYLYDGLQTLQSTLIKKSAHLMPEAEIREGCDKILKECVEKLDKNFDRFEVYVKSNILKIPQNVILLEDEIHETPRAKARAARHAPTFEELEMEYDKLREKLAEELERKARYDKILKDQEVVLRNFDVLRDEATFVKELATILDISSP